MATKLKQRRRGLRSDSDGRQLCLNSDWRELCLDCGVDTSAIGHFYMVKKAIWAASGLGPADGMLCLDCLERRIGRPLTSTDFGATPDNPEARAYWGGERMLPHCWRRHLDRRRRVTRAAVAGAIGPT